MGMCGGRSGGLRCAQAWDKNNVATASNCSEAFIGFSELPKSFLASFGYTSRIMAPWKLTLLKSPGVRAGIGVGTAAFMLGADSAKNLGPVAYAAPAAPQIVCFWRKADPTQSRCPMNVRRLFLAGMAGEIRVVGLSRHLGCSRGRTARS